MRLAENVCNLAENQICVTFTTFAKFISKFATAQNALALCSSISREKDKRSTFSFLKEYALRTIFVIEYNMSQ